MELLQLAITGLSVVAAILAWIAKIRWSKEYSDAKEATIAAKDAQIQVLEKQIEELRDLTPMKLREYLRSSQELLEEHIDNLKREVEEVKTESKTKDEKIRYLSAAGHQKENELTLTIMEKEELNQRVADLEEEINKLKTVSEEVTTASGSLNTITSIIVGGKRLTYSPAGTAEWLDETDSPAFYDLEAESVNPSL